MFIEGKLLAAQPKINNHAISEVKKYSHTHTHTHTHAHTHPTVLNYLTKLSNMSINMENIHKSQVITTSKFC